MFPGANQTYFVLKAFADNDGATFSVNDMMYYRGACTPHLSGWTFPNHATATTGDEWTAHVEIAYKSLQQSNYLETLNNAISNKEIAQALLALLGGDSALYQQVLEEDDTLVLVPIGDGRACSLAVLSHLPVQDIRVDSIQYDGEAFKAKMFIPDFMHMLAKVLCHFFKRALGLGFVISGSTASFIDIMKAHFSEQCDGFSFSFCQCTGKISLTFDWGTKSSNVIDIALRLTDLFPRHLLNDTPQQRKLKSLLTDAFKLLQEIIHMYHERDVNKQKHVIGYMVALTNSFYHIIIMLSGAHPKTIVAYSNVFLNQMTHWANVATAEGLSIERATSARGNESQHHSIQTIMSSNKQSLSSTSPQNRIIASLTSLFDAQMVPHVFGGALGLFDIRLKNAKLTKDKFEVEMNTKPWYVLHCSKQASILAIMKKERLGAHNLLLGECHSRFLNLTEAQLASLKNIIETTQVKINRDDVKDSWEILTRNREEFIDQGAIVVRYFFLILWRVWCCIYIYFYFMYM